ncbi:MAG: acetylglucosamine-6-sulfatase, partial [Bacteroidota bacterium]
MQNKSWKYIRYYKNENFSATKKVAVAKKLGLNVNSILYKRHDLDMIVYHDYIESSLSGEIPVYEELYQLEDDPQESN